MLPLTDFNNFLGNSMDSIPSNEISMAESGFSSLAKKSLDQNEILNSALIELRNVGHGLVINRQSSDLEEYWNCWNYWKKNPFISNNTSIFSKLLMEQ
jgi:hypothetical protein